MIEYGVGALLFLSSLVGGKDLPPASDLDWKIEQAWTKRANSYWSLEAISSKVITDCAKNPEMFVLLPQVIHGVHTLSVDGVIVMQSGDPSFAKSTAFYEQPYIQCTYLSRGSLVQWRVSSYAEYFSRLQGWPKLVVNPEIISFFNVSLNSISGCVLIILAVFSALIFYGRVSHQLTFSVVFGTLATSAYFIGAGNLFFGYQPSMLVAHKLADVGLWTGAIFLFNSFRSEKILPNGFYFFLVISIFFAYWTILTGNTGDQIQVGTMIPMPAYMSCCVAIIFHLLKDGLRSEFSRDKILRIGSIALFILFGYNDVLHIVGVIKTHLLLSFGIVGGIIGISTAVNEEIGKTYLERDSLLKNLEQKVAEKTADLQQAMGSLRATQAELIQSERLASLGTLSAGVAHEINNAINYVNGALVPLERKVMASAAEADKPILTKLFAAIREGTELTVAIVKSLRNYTGLNQANSKDVYILEVVNSVLTILKNRLKGTDVSVEIDKNLHVLGSMVGLNQVFMNLITNSLDAFNKDDKKITIRAAKIEKNIVLEVIDNGSGIPKEIINRIYDPFFTTKEVGKGTGLGMHIVKKEVDRHHGTIEVLSEVNVGTTFKITIPAITSTDAIIKEAA